MRIKINKNYFEAINSKWFFFAICIIYIISSYILNEIVITNKIYINTLGEQLSIERISRIFEIRERWSWVNYVSLPFLVALKLLLVSFTLNIGVFVYGYKINFSRIFKIAVIAELIFVIADISKTAYFIFNSPSSLNEINYFYPLSITCLIDSKKIADWLIYPLQQINVFELFYWLLLTLGLKINLDKKFSYTLKMVISSYGIGLLIFILLFMFIAINNG